MNFYNWTYIDQERASQTIPNYVTKFPVTQHIQILKLFLLILNFEQSI